MSDRTHPEPVDDTEQIVGNVLTRVTVDRIFDLFTVHGKSARDICKRFGISRELVDGALRCKVNQLREASLPRTAFGKPIRREVISMPSRAKGIAA